MPRTRVLVVDDSAVYRRALGQALAADPEIEVVGSAASGEAAVELIRHVSPDVVTMDVAMPGMGGLAALEAIQRIAPGIGVVMVSSSTRRGGADTLEALSRGARGYVTKPERSADVTELGRELVARVKQAATATRRRPAPGETPSAPPAAPVPLGRSLAAEGRARPPATDPNRRVDLVAIGTSTGGPEALAEVMSALPRSFPVPVLIVQHMPPTFTKLLADRLDARQGIRVVEGTHGLLLEPGVAVIAPGDFHMVVVRDGTSLRVGLNRELPESSCRPAYDVLLRSVAFTLRDRSLAVVLTGMGQDGHRGTEAVRAAGGVVWCQDQATSAVWGMPGSVARAGLAHRVLPLAEIGPAIARRVSVGRSGGHRIDAP